MSGDVVTWTQCVTSQCKKLLLLKKPVRREPTERLIPLAPALPTFGDERVIGARLQLAADKMLIAPEAKA